MVIYKKAPDEREYSGALLADKNKRTDIRFLVDFLSVILYYTKRRTYVSLRRIP